MFREIFSVLEKRGRQCQTLEPYLVPCKKIQTFDKDKNSNGALWQLANLETSTHCPSVTLPIELVYLTYCNPDSFKGPHVHSAPKWDRFCCVEGDCIVFARQEETKKYYYFPLSSDNPSVLYIPPGVSHGIYSIDGSVVLSICNERFVQGHYNQEEVEYPSDILKEVKKQARHV